MPQDLFTVRRLHNELQPQLLGAKIQKINVIDDFEINFITYNGSTVKLCLSARAKYSRICFTKREKPNPVVAKNFCMLLRKHLTGAKITATEIVGNDRIIKIVCDNENDLKEKVTKSVYLEIMNKYSNVFLVSDGIILGSLRQAPQNLDGKRIILAGAKYVLPEKQVKANPYDLKSLIEFYADYKGGNLENFILNGLDGVSPTTAAEIAYRINLKGEFSTDSAADVTDKFFNEKNAPVIIYNGKSSDYYAFDYLHVQGERKYFSSLNDAVDFWANEEENKLKFDALKNALTSKIRAFEKKQLKNLSAVDEKLREAENAEKIKLTAELITANMYALKKGMTTASFVNYYSENGETVTVSLDKNLTPNENAQKYYKKYAKLKKTLNALLPRKEEILSELEYVDNVKYEIERADDEQTLNDISIELSAAALSDKIKNNANGKQKKKQPQISSPREYVFKEFTIKVGKNNVQNDELTFSSKRYDVWLHAKNYHSSHVIIQTDNKPVDDSVILVAAEICAYFSNGKNGDKIPVDYTLKKFVKKPPKAKPGSVIYTDFKTVLVTPNEHKKFAK